MGNCGSCAKAAEKIERLVMGCAGGSNLGQISNRLMVLLKERYGLRPYCLAGVGAELEQFIKTSKELETVVIDGCAVGCGKKIFEKNGIAPEYYFVVSDMGIEKSYNYDMVERDTEIVYNKIVKKI